MLARIDDCEQRFHRNGEDWMLDNFWRSEREFCVRDSLRAVPCTDWGPVREYDASGLRGIDELVYFAASVFWRGTLAWRSAGGFGSPAKLDFGPYEDELRFFLLRRSSFPANVVLSTFISAASTRLGHVQFPFHQTREAGGAHLYWFSVPGLSFGMWVGREIRSDARALCTARSGRILSAGDADGLNFDRLVRVMSKAKPVGKLSKR